MPHGDKKKTRIRGQTDTALRTERANADREFARRTAAAAEDADEVLQTARDRADAVLDAARRREDKKASGRAANEVAGERSAEDAAIREERRVSDVTLAAERVRRQVALSSLVAAERHDTDSSLLIERRRTDEDLTHRDDFLAMLSHDLRSLLGIIAMNATFIERQGRHDPARTTRSAAAIQRTTAQMTRLVTDLLDVASFDAGKLVLLRHDVGTIVRDAVDAFEPTAHAANLSVSVDVPSEDLTAELDPDRLAQALGNLLGNAAKFTHAGGRITLGAERRGPDIIVFVADTGEGIPPEKMETIFERYTQIGRPNRQGLGLGLYIARRIVETHGGRLWAESTVGHGSTFFFSVPFSGS